MLVSLTNVSLAFGLDHLLDEVNVQIEAGERVCLIGRNGAGKSSLFKVIDGSLVPDSGVVWRHPTLRMARLAQELPIPGEKTVFEFVAEGLEEAGKLLAEYHALAEKMETQSSAQALDRMHQLQMQIEACGGWQYEQEINTVLTRLELPADKLLSELSGGWQRRAALGRALVMKPELLLLDEPTNHLDIAAIQWLEEYLLDANGGILFITHDRSLLQRLATRIIELDRGQLTSWPGDYPAFLQHKDELLLAEEKHHADFDKKLAQEEKWIRQGIKARRTRNEGRVRALEAMRAERKRRRVRQGQVTLTANVAQSSGQIVVEATDVTQTFDGRCVIRNFSTTVMRGDRIGLIGPNGIGKSTLLNILLGRMAPEQGTVKLGTNLKIAYFDQQRAALDLTKTVADNVTLGSDMLEINGERRHIISYLGDFLFSPQRARTPVKALSGGECNRLLLAKLFSVPSNVLVMDEPTNDLDIETLELLESLLADYQGTLLLVSHDRKFLDNVITSSLVFEGNGVITEYTGGYEDWLRQRQPVKPVAAVAPAPAKPKVEKTPEKRTKLSFKEQQELSRLPQLIESLELEEKSLHAQLADPQFYKQGGDAITVANKRLEEIARELVQAYERWGLLEK